MNWKPPAYVREAAAQALESVETNHYSLPKGRTRLRNALADFFSESFALGRKLDAETEIVVTAGANEGTLLAIAVC